MMMMMIIISFLRSVSLSLFLLLSSSREKVLTSRLAIIIKNKQKEDQEIDIRREIEEKLATTFSNIFSCIFTHSFFLSFFLYLSTICLVSCQSTQRNRPSFLSTELTVENNILILF